MIRRLMQLIKFVLGDGLLETIEKVKSLFCFLFELRCLMMSFMNMYEFKIN